MKYVFGDIVVVDGNNIGVIVKSWIIQLDRSGKKEKYNYEVYVCLHNRIIEYPESQIDRYLVRHKYLSDEEMQYQFNAMNGL